MKIKLKEENMKIKDQKIFHKKVNDTTYEYKCQDLTLVMKDNKIKDLYKGFDRVEKIEDKEMVKEILLLHKMLTGSEDYFNIGNKYYISKKSLERKMNKIKTNKKEEDKEKLFLLLNLCAFTFSTAFFISQLISFKSNGFSLGTIAMMAFELVVALQSFSFFISMGKDSVSENPSELLERLKKTMSENETPYIEYEKVEETLEKLKIDYDFYTEDDFIKKVKNLKDSNRYILIQEKYNSSKSIDLNEEELKRLAYQYQEEENLKNTKSLKIDGNLYINSRILKDYILNSDGYKEYKKSNKREWLKYIALELICPIFWFASYKYLETFLVFLMEKEIDIGLSLFIFMLWLTIFLFSIGLWLIICPVFFYTNIRKRKIFKKIIPSLLKETQPFIPYKRETEKAIKELNLEDVFIKDDFDILIDDYSKKYAL